MRSLTLLLALAAVLLLTGCLPDPKPDPNYEALVSFHKDQAEREQKRLDALAAMATNCDGDDCVEKVALTFMAAQLGGGRSAPQIPVYRKQYHPAWSIATAMAPQILPTWGGKIASDNARDTTLGLYGFLGDSVSALANSPALSAPSITVGGDYVPGTQHTGDAIGGDVVSVGRDQIGGSQHVGDATTIGRDAIGGDQHVGDSIGRDAIGGDRIDDSNIGDGNRIDSDGPFETDNSGDRCTGDRCQGDGDINPPPPDDDDAEPVDPNAPRVGPRPPGG